jgi:hypothetical protein
MTAEFLIKPIKQSTLMAAVQRMLSPSDGHGPTQGSNGGTLSSARRGSASEYSSAGEASHLRLLCVDDNVRRRQVLLCTLSSYLRAAC